MAKKLTGDLMQRAAVAALVALVASSNAMAESWLCVSEQSTGFAYEKGAWVNATFRAAKKFVIRPAAEVDKAYFATIGQYSIQFVTVYLGEQLPMLGCNSGTGSSAVMLFCANGIEDMMFNRTTLRFQSYYKPGYTDGTPSTDTNDNTPSMWIGTCSAIS